MSHPTSTMCRTDEGCGHPECVPIGSRSNPRPSIDAACRCHDIGEACACEARSNV